MSTSLKPSLFAAAPVRGIMLALATGALLAGCIVAAPPPPRVYAAPPPPPPPPPAPTYDAPADEAQASEAPPALPEYPQPPCPVDAGLLGLGTGRLLLGAGHLGAAAARRSALDSRLLGLRRWRVRVPCRLLGSAHRFLRRSQLWLRIYRRRFRRWPLGWWRVCLQSGRRQHQRERGAQHLQRDRRQQCHGGQQGQLQRWSRRYRCRTDGSGANGCAGAAHTSHAAAASARAAGGPESRTVRQG